MNNILKATSFLFRRATARLRSQPDFIILGAQKSGTRSLKKYLSSHTQINMTSAPEVHYFDLNFKRGINWYLSHFKIKRENKLAGECSPYYIFHPLVPKRIHQSMRQCKFIVLLRDPVERAFSHYRMRKERGEEPMDLISSAKKWQGLIEEEEIAIRDGSLARGIHHQKYSYIQRGEYAKQIERWFAYFPKDQFIFIQSELFFKDPQSAMNGITDFLGLKSEPVKDKKVYNKGKLQMAMTTEERSFLVEYYKSKNEVLYELLDRKFNWE